MADNKKVTVQIKEDHYKTNVQAHGFNLIADEPESAGGTNLGPTPYGYLLSGLGACIAITVRMYADRKGWPLEGVELDLTHEKIKAEECDECETEKGIVDRISINIEFKGDLDDAQLARLLDIAGKCPVHRTLTSETMINKTMLVAS
jgi:putative redox protein